MLTTNTSDRFILPVTQERDLIIEQYNANEDYKNIPDENNQNSNRRILVPSYSTPKKIKKQKLYNTLLLTQLFPEKKYMSISENKFHEKDECFDLNKNEIKYSNTEKKQENGNLAGNKNQKKDSKEIKTNNQIDQSKEEKNTLDKFFQKKNQSPFFPSSQNQHEFKTPTKFNAKSSKNRSNKIFSSVNNSNASSLHFFGASGNSISSISPNVSVSSNDSPNKQETLSQFFKTPAKNIKNVNPKFSSSSLKTKFTTKKTHQIKLPFTSDSNYNNFLNLKINVSSPGEKKEIFSLVDYIKESKRTQPKLVKVLDAPGLLDDYYLHLLSWSKNNIISVCLGSNVYLYNHSNSSISNLSSIQKEIQGDQGGLGDYLNISSCCFLEDPNNLVLGYPNGVVDLYDIPTHKYIMSFTSHESRVGVIDALPNDFNLFCTGSKDKSIMLHDKRSGSKPIRIFIGNNQEICGLKWAKSSKMLASGSNDNRILIYSIEQEKPIHIFNNAHQSAVRALDWSSLKYNFLASGGGVQDRTLKFWNCSTMKMEFQVKTDSQICNLAFGNHNNELVTSHGYNDNKLNIWELKENWQEIHQIESFKTDQSRILYMAVAPNNRSIVTGAGDTVRIWDVFSEEKKKGMFSQLSLDNFSIR